MHITHAKHLPLLLRLEGNLAREDGMGLNYTKGSDETRIMHSMPQASSCYSGKYGIVRRTCTVHAMRYCMYLVHALLVPGDDSDTVA